MLIVGTDNSETLNGTPGDDEIIGLRGNDTVNGQGGNDLIYWRTGSYAPTSDGGDTVDGGDGSDRFLVIAGTAQESPNTHAIYRFTHSYRLEVTLGGSVAWTMRSFGLSINPSEPDVDFSVAVSLTGIESFSFHGAYGPSQRPDDAILVGDLAGTALTGLLVFDLGPGRDTLDGFASRNAISASGGDGNDVLVGGLGNDELLGGAGNDLLRGNAGSNTLIGGPGDDSYDTDNRSDSVIELAGGGFDTLSTRASFFILHNEVENLLFIGTGDFTGLGNTLNNVIEGQTGNDYLIGAEGNDTLDGHGGLDTLQGGAGDDTYFVDSSGDTVYELAGEGTDTVFTLVQAYTLASNVENLRPAGITDRLTWTGNAIDNLIVGSSVADELFGLAGNDILDSGNGGNNGGNRLVGGTGNDTYRIQSANDQIVELAGEGIDTIEIRLPVNQQDAQPSPTTYTLPANVENVVITVNSDTAQHGNALNNQMIGAGGRDNFTGEDGDDRLLGNSGNDTLSGGAGNDTLEGGAGGDLLSGGAGNDRVDGGAGADELTGGGGADVFVFADPSQQDMVHDFVRAEGDKVNVAALLASAGYTGSDPFADGYLRIVPLPATPQFEAFTRLQFDPDGSAGPQGFLDVAIFRGGTDVIAPQDFIFS